MADKPKRPRSRPERRIPSPRDAEEARLQAQRDIIIRRIRERMDEIGWTPIDLAAAIRTSEKTTYRWVAGEYAPRAEYLVSIARALDVSPMYLLGLSDEATPLHELLPAETTL